LQDLIRRESLSRRDFLRVAASAGAVGAGAVLLGACSDDGKGSPTSTPGIVIDPPPETTTLRLGKSVTPCQGPLHLAEQFLPAEGFTTVQYIDEGSDIGRADRLAAGEIDLDIILVQDLVAAADAGDQLVILAGVYNTCWELFGNERVQSLRDLKGKRIWAYSRTNSAYGRIGHVGHVEALLAYVGIGRSEVEYVELSVGDGLQQFEAGTIDAIAVAALGSTALRIARIGHVILDGAADPPWSQYFGGMVTGNREFAEKHPAATKRALRAILKATDVCAREPERAARNLADKGVTIGTYDLILDAISELSYAAWREFNPEDTMRFYALRLREAGLVKSTPDELIARATDWRYLEEIKRELAV
jgi:NitT/TauT family transport system substrate-binding protein